MALHIMEQELIKDKVYYKIFDRTYKGSTGIYSKHKHNDAAKLAEIQKNIDNIRSEYSADELIILKQVHGDNVICSDDIDSSRQIEADGVVSTKKNVALSILTADCVPVLFASNDGLVIGAAHCGWKSAKLNLIKKTHDMMKKYGAKQVKAIIGPSIAQKSYEVDSNYYQNFIKIDKDCNCLFKKSVNKNSYMFDLSGYIKYKLHQENIELLVHIDEDTYSMPEKYPSYRRSTHGIDVYKENILSTIIIR